MSSATRLIPTEITAALLAALVALLSYTHSTAPQPSSSTVQSVPAEQAVVVEAPSSPIDLTRRVEPSTEGPMIPAQTAPAPLAIDPRAQQVLQLVNAERSQAGCGPVQMEPRLSAAALAHSQDMADRDYFEHNNPDGNSPAERVRAAGYTWSSTGENIAYGYDTPQQVMNGWMSSEGHRENILNCGWVDMGLGIVDNGTEAPYWTQEFGTTSSTWQRGQ